MFRSASAALGLTAISLSGTAEPLVAGTHRALYHWTGTAFQLFGPVAFDLLLFWAVMTAVLFSAERAGRWRVAVWLTVLVLFLPRVLLGGFQRLSRDVFASAPLAMQTWLVRLQEHAKALGPAYWRVHFAVALALWIVLFLLWRPSRTLRYERGLRFCITVLMFAGISGGLLFAELGYAWARARGVNDARALQTRGTGAQTSVEHRLILIVMDEMSHDQVFEHRFAGLQLPAIDELSGTSTVFSQVQPAGFATDYAVPALFTGESYDDMRANAQGGLVVRNNRTRKWQAFDQQNTIFKDALQMGLSTSVAGWYNPYCRILSSVLNSCVWEDRSGWQQQTGVTADLGFWNNALNLFTPLLGERPVELMAKVLHDPEVGPARNRGGRYAPLHIEDYEELERAGDRQLLDRSAGFVFLHLPIPHPGGIYDRRRHEFRTTGATYIDNLALADDYLGHVRSILTLSGQWDSSHVVIMGDHSWRTQLWMSENVWSELEQRASMGGKFDPRPLYLVKLAGQHTGARVDAPYDALRTRTMLNGLMNGSLQKPQQLGQWAEGAAVGQ